VAVSSHELYHFWNVCRIRPKEIKSYDLSREILLDTGLVLEGVTTYMGDLYLLKSGYYSLEDYLLVLEKLINREFGSFGWENQSLVESSRDLWLDGYKVGIPDKKVSIYNRGALISLCLDLMLLDQESSLQQVMTDMWIKFAKKGVGYSMSDFQFLIKLKFSEEEKINNFFSSIVYGREDIVSFLQELLQGIGLVIQTIYSSNILKHNFGIITDEKGKVIRIHPRSEAYYKVMLGDRILAVGDDRVPTEENLNSQTLELSIIRWCQKLSISVNGENVLFFPEYKVSIDSESLKRNRWMI
jgi:predicted metalloprotease with PDZ domain